MAGNALAFAITIFIVNPEFALSAYQSRTLHTPQEGLLRMIHLLKLSQTRPAVTKTFLHLFIVVDTSNLLTFIA